MNQVGFRQRISAALERGDRALREYQELLERGSAEDIWIDEMIRGAAVRWNILRSRALTPVREPNFLQRMQKTAASGVMRFRN